MLKDKLESYAKSGIYPFHMPGHKRNENLASSLPITHDMTEVDGLDDLHCPNGILKEAMDNASEFFGADKTFFLVNGSTCGILAALASCTKRGDKIICARNCHKSVYNGISLLGISPLYITPKTIPLPFGIYGSIEPSAIAETLNQSPDVSAVIITSPTYEGVISDIKSISKLCHAHNVPLIVDEAHGAHLGHFGGFECGAVKCGADIVIQSTHKTLGAVTQSALLHICGNIVNPDKVAQKLSVFETSSPSYLIMESIDSAICTLQKNGNELFSAYSARLSRFSEKAKCLKNIEIMFYGKNEGKSYGDVFAFDRGKLIISAVKLGISGVQLAEILLKKYKIQVEMSSLNYIVAMTSYCDTDAGFERLFTALSEIDRSPVGTFVPKDTVMPTGYTRAIEIFEAEQLDVQEVPFEESAGKVCGEFVFAYPPGIPLIVPGEMVTDELIGIIHTLKSAGVAIKSSISGDCEHTAIIKKL